MPRVKGISEETVVLCGDKVSAGSSEEPFDKATVRLLRGGEHLCVSAGRGGCCFHKDRNRGVWVDLEQVDGVDIQRVLVCGVKEGRTLSTADADGVEI